MIDKAEGITGMLAVLALVAAGVWAYRKLPSSASVAAAAQALNPTNPNNIAASATNAVVQAVTGDPNQTLGGWLYDATHTAYDPNAPAAQATNQTLGGWLYDATHTAYDPNAPAASTGGASGSWGAPAASTGGASGSWGAPVIDQTVTPADTTAPVSPWAYMMNG